MSIILVIANAMFFVIRVKDHDSLAKLLNGNIAKDRFLERSRILHNIIHNDF
jgi:hypothetical protein